MNLIDDEKTDKKTLSENFESSNYNFIYLKLNG